MKIRGKLVRIAAATGAAMLAGAGMAVSAEAQEIDINPPEQAYVGPILGYDTLVVSTLGDSGSMHGLTYGGMAGIDTPIGKRGRAGLEAQVAGSTASTSLIASDGVNTFEGKLAAGVDIYIGGKLGWMVAPKTQIFTTLGYANSKFTYSERLNGIKIDQYGRSLSGVRVGAGVEYALTPHMRARLEYRYTHYGQVSLAPDVLSVKAERHQVVGGLLYGF